jgi:uncharacterized protein
MNTPVIIDSSALFALVSRDDAHHQEALRVSQELARTHRAVVLLPEVFAESLNIVGKKLGRSHLFNLADEVLHSGDFIFPDQTQQMRENAISLLTKQAASVSYIDALVMAYADLFNTKDIFGFDEAFARSGYRLPAMA